MKHLIFITAITGLLIFTLGCLKDEISKHQSTEIVQSEQKDPITLENFTIDFGKRDGVQPAPFLFLETMDMDNYFLPQDREHILFNPHMIDSVKMFRNNANFANLISSTSVTPITNYSATFHFKNGQIETFRVLSKVRSDNFTWIPDISKSLVTANETNNILKFLITRLFEKERLPYRGNSVKLYKWQLSGKSGNSYVVIDTLLLFPETKFTNQWQPLQSY